MTTIRRALISLTDKGGIVEFARQLAELKVELISTGGTARVLRGAGLQVIDVSEVTGFPEMLDGRVKTINPRISAGVLAVRDNPEHMAALASHGIGTIDMVVVNLYAFEKTAAKPGVTIEEMIENIDIGGPTLIRAAAKNWQDVAVVTDPGDYVCLTEELRANAGQLSKATHWKLAQKAFSLTASYDRAISARLASIDAEGVSQPDEELPAVLDIRAPRAMSLRYGENPHQKAALYSTGEPGIASAEQLQGKELSYNNYVDLDAAWQLICEFEKPATAIIKHTNPCGCAEQETLVESYHRAFACDPVSAYGGVLAFNRPLDEETARELARTFVECIVAPDYTEQARAVLAAKKNLRLVKMAHKAGPGLVIKSIPGGFLAQTADTHKLVHSETVLRTLRAPTEEEWAALGFAWKVVKHVKSNAIVYARAGQVVGVGAGQMSRVDSVKIGAMKAVLPLDTTVVASDAFFPFPDGVEQAASHGVTAVIQPGGSVRDEEVVAAADRLGLAMVFTEVRHFRH
jgi:phosphoribosylaminoimidazolecarboxamide formyltransferase/IMP cyclohydrolase